MLNKLWIISAAEAVHHVLVAGSSSAVTSSVKQVLAAAGTALITSDATNIAFQLSNSRDVSVCVCGRERYRMLSNGGWTLFINVDEAALTKLTQLNWQSEWSLWSLTVEFVLIK